eukprot:gene12198-337_t
MLPIHHAAWRKTLVETDKHSLYNLCDTDADPAAKDLEILKPAHTATYDKK